MGSTLSQIIPLDAFIELELESSINDFMDAMDIKMDIEDAKKKLKKRHARAKRNAWKLKKLGS